KPLLTVPPQRFKSNTPHLTPLSTTARALVKELHTFVFGDYLFTANGKHPIKAYASAKQRLDKFMAKELGYEPAPWVLHDLRRVVRSNLSALKVDENVAEAVI